MMKKDNAMKKDKKNKNPNRPKPHGNGGVQGDGGSRSQAMPAAPKFESESPFMLNLWKDFEKSKGYTKIKATHRDWTRGFLEHMAGIMDPIHRHNLVPRPKCMQQTPFCSKAFESEALTFLMGRKNRAIKQIASAAKRLCTHRNLADSLDLAEPLAENDDANAMEEDSKDDKLESFQTDTGSQKVSSGAHNAEDSGKIFVNTTLYVIILK
jgi:hypothetical protein